MNNAFQGFTNMNVLRSVSTAVLLTGLAFSAHAQTEPSVKIGTAPLATPDVVNAFYGTNTTSTLGLQGLDPITPAVPAEIVDLARALRNDPDLIYDYVRNNVRTEWLYGLKKGPVATAIELAGTPFDQVSLMVALLRQASYTASYEVGKVTLSGADWQKWTGITSAAATCSLLSSGGFGAIVNGDSSKATCDWGTATVSSVELSHIWVKVNIGGTDYVFDPSFKPHTFKAGIDLAGLAGMSAGAPMAAATAATPNGPLQTGTTTADPNTGADAIQFARRLNGPNLGASLQTYGSNLLTNITANYRDGEMTDIVGGDEIVRYDGPDLRQTALGLPYTSATTLHSWTGGIPDQYRTVLKLTIRKARPGLPPLTPYEEILGGGGQPITLYSDEIAGRRLSYRILESSKNEFRSQLTVHVQGLRLTIATYNAPNNNTPQFVDTPDYSNGQIVMSVDHPYAANGGTYMDASMTTDATYLTNLTFVHGWGETTERMVEKWDGRSDSAITGYAETYNGCDACTSNFYHASHGDGRRERIVVGWLAQSSIAAQLHARIATSVYAHHHSVGVAYGDSSVKNFNINNAVTQPAYVVWSTVDSFDRMSVVSGFSLTSKLADAAARRAAVHAIAATSATLEGSAAGQVIDAVDVSSTAERFRWANNPPAGEPNGGSDPARYFYVLNSSNAGEPEKFIAGPNGNLLLLENEVESTTSDTQAKTTCTVGASHLGNLGFRLSDAIDEYVGAGYEVIAAGEVFLGPGTRCGPWDDYQHAGHLTPDPYSFWPRFPSLQRGGALVATKYDPLTGEPTDIAHVVTSAQNTAKGGGGSAQANHQTSYDPAEAADILKARFVDRSSAHGVDLKKGSVAYASPVSLTVGNGEFPYKLSASLKFSDALQGGGQFGPTALSEPQPPWTSNWQNSLSMSSSGMEAMGKGDVRASAGTLAAFIAMQDIYKQSRSPQREVAAALVNAWWADTMVGNVVTVQVGADAKQFVKTIASTGNPWIAPGAGPQATLTQTGTRAPMLESACNPQPEEDVILTRTWNPSGLSFKVTNPQGDEQTFSYWMEKFDTNSEGACGRQRGFRLTTWTWPQGVTVTVNYSVPDAYSLPMISSVTNNLNRTLNFTYTNYGFGYLALNGFNNGLSGADLRQVSLSTTSSSDTHTDQENKATKFTYETVDGRRALKEVFSPLNPTVPVLRYNYDADRRIKDVSDGVALQEGTRGPHQFFIAGGVRGERVDPNGGSYVVLYDLPPRPGSDPQPPPSATVRMDRHVNELGFATEISYDGRGRVLEYLYPEFDKERFEYDTRNNTTKVTKIGKPGTTHSPSLPDIVIEAGWHATWNKPTFVKDALGRQTDFTYYSTGNGKGLIWTATRPAPDPTAPTVRPVYTFTYNSLGQLTQSQDPTALITTNTYQTTGNRNLLSTAINPSGINILASFITDAQGDVTQTTDPLNVVTRQTYDKVRRTLETLQHNGGVAAALIAAQRAEYDDEGRVIVEKAGKTFSGTTVTLWETIGTKTYTPTGKVKTDTDGDNRTTSYQYDGLDRVTLVADPQGRQTRSTYDLAGQLVVEQRAYGSRNEIDYATYTYAPSGNRTSLKDAKNNVTNYTFDVFHRPVRTCFPGTTNCDTTPTGGTPIYEQITAYDAQGNALSRRNRAAETLSYTYDGLDRMKTKVASGATTTWGYDLAGRVTSITDTAAYSITNGYDTAKRLTSTARTVPGLAGSQTVAYQLDKNGNRTRLTWPDTAYFVDYTYDNLNRMDLVRRNSTNVANFDYDYRSRRTLLTYFNNRTVSTPTYSIAGDLQSLTHNFGNAAYNVTFNYTYTNAHQLQGVTAVSTASYLCASTSCAPFASKSYATNALNQYTDISGQAITHDLKGNLTGDGVWTFSYDAENRLMSATKTGSTVTYGYDPLGHRAKKTVNGVTTFYLGDAQDEEIAEYDGTGVLLNRFIPGPAIDQPVAQVTAAGLQTYFHKDKLGSVIAMSGPSGVYSEGPYKYDAYGQGAAATGTPYKYTGRRLDGAAGDTGLYYYRARYYSPALGRFMQADPIGVQDDVNLYAYVKNNPTNNTDPTGKYVEAGFEAVSLATGVQSFADNASSGDYAAAAVDAAGLIVDAVSAAIPGVPGVAGLGIKAARETGKVAGKVSQRAATREAKAKAGIPRSQQPTKQTNGSVDGTKVGRQQTYEVPKAGGGTESKSVQVSRDQEGAHAGQSQVEAGTVKPGGQVDAAGRPRIQNEDKVRVDFDPSR